MPSTDMASVATPTVAREVLPERVAERRVVTVLFADLIGFTTLAEARDPELVRELLTRYFEVASEIVERYGGSIEKFIGDAVMAVWGAPVAHEDDAERAVRAALDLIDRIHGLEFEGKPVDMRAGIVTGEAAVTLGAVDQGVVAGDIVNTASRLQSAAAAGTILVGRVTRDATSGAIAYESAGEHVLKGKETPVPAWRPLRVIGMVGGVGRSDVLEPPFTGRDAELRMIKDLLHVAGREQRLRMMSVIGQPGIGKSRLIWEFHKYIDGITETINWHQGRSPAYGQGTAFSALGEMVRKRARLADGDDPATTRAGITATVAEHVADDEERRWITPRLLQLLGVEEGRGGDRDELFAAWRTFFERVSEQGTVVLVFEDIQWADTGLLDFIDHLGEWSRGHPILVITLARPELLERRADWGAARRNFVSLSLEPLPEDDMRGLLAGLAPGLPQDLTEAILRRADGIPLYAVETVRMLLHGGRLEVVDGRYQPVGGTIELQVPETLQALVAARLDALDPTDRALLQDAAVLGQAFSAEALAAVVDADLPGLTARLRALERREMLAQDSDPRSPERGQFGFVQALIREVAYATLSRHDRRARHLAAARYYEGLGDDELSGVLASHYLAAYRAVPEGDAGKAVAVQARLALRGAAERATAVYAFDQVLEYLEQALSIKLADDGDADLHERAGFAALQAGRADDAEHHLVAAIERYTAMGDASGMARATAQLGSTYVLTGQIEPAIGVLTASLEAQADLEAEPAMATIAGQLARAYMIHEEPQVALVWAEKTLVAAERMDMLEEVADAMNTRALALHIVGRLTESTTTLRGVIWLAEHRDLTQAGLRAYNNLSFMLSTIDPRSALELALTGLERARKVASVTWAPLLAATAASAAFRIGDWETALTLIGEARDPERPQLADVELWSIGTIIDACRGLGPASRGVAPSFSGSTDPQEHAILRLTDAWVALLDGRLDASHDSAMETAKLATGYAINAHAVAARAALWASDASRFDMTAVAFDDLAIHGDSIEATRTTMRASGSWLDGRDEDAQAATSTALEMWMTLGARFEYAMTVLDAVIASARSGEGRLDRRWLEEPIGLARSILESIGATALLNRLDGASVTAEPVPPGSAAATDGSTRPKRLTRQG
jgi:class 3 adenylate cyclase/tetratricopeptide (TPR) repeat protein